MKLKPFTVLTDNNPLTYVLTTAKLDATGHRWISALSAYDFNIQYRLGLKNSDADALSRYPTEDLKTIDNSSVKAICGCLRATIPCMSVLPSMSINIVETIEVPGQPLAQKELREVRRRQREDPLIEKWRKAVIDQQLPRYTSGREDTTMKRHFKSFTMKRGVLYKTLKKDDQEK